MLPLANVLLLWGYFGANLVSLEVAHLSELELRQEILTLRRRVQKLAALLQLVLALLRASGVTLSRQRLPDGRAKLRILHAVDRARACIPLRALLQFLHVSPSRFHAWRRREAACALDDHTSCPRTAPHRLTPAEVEVIKEMVTSSDYRHVPTGTLAVLAQLFLHSLESVATVRRLVAFYVDEHNRVLPHSAFRGQRRQRGAPDRAIAQVGGQNRARDQRRCSSVARWCLGWRELARDNPGCRWR